MVNDLIRIMIVENHADFRELFRNYLESKHEGKVIVDCASDMEEAISMAQRCTGPSLLFCDYRMGAHIGPDIVKRMRANMPHPFFPVYMSSDPSVEEIVRAQEGVAAAFISKIGMEAADGHIHAAPSLLAMAQLAQWVLVDQMTGLLNHVGLFDKAVYVLAQAKRERISTVCMFIDADRFKHINDTYGHGVGDLAICAIAESLKRTMRESDLVCRRSGDEFMIILPHTTAEEAEYMADRIREDIKKVRVPLDDGGSIGLEVSIGIAEMSADELTMDHKEDFKILEGKSDAAMYGVKKEKKQKAA